MFNSLHIDTHLQTHLSSVEGVRSRCLRVVEKYTPLLQNEQSSQLDEDSGGENGQNLQSVKPGETQRRDHGSRSFTNLVHDPCIQRPTLTKISSNLQTGNKTYFLKCNKLLLLHVYFSGKTKSKSASSLLL